MTTLSLESPSFEKVTHSVPPQRLYNPNSLPVPTHVFWNNLILETGTNPIYTSPYMAWFNDSGFNFNVSTLNVTNTFISSNTVINMAINNSTKQTFTVTYWDSFTCHVTSGNLKYIYLYRDRLLSQFYVLIMNLLSSQHNMLLLIW
jgi:endoglucanase Acf2